MLFPLKPDPASFAPPSDMPADTHIVIEDSGRIFGYVTHWNRCLLDGGSECWTAPSSPSKYALAHCGDTLLNNGAIVKTANIGGSAGHAPGANGAMNAARWYQDTSTQLARVRYGEDENGIWFAGALWPDVCELDIARLRASGLSGDWRWITDEGRYDFVGACMVNVPGLPLYRAASAGDHPNIIGRSIELSASGSTSLGLINDRNKAWDSTAAEDGLRKWASSDGSGSQSKIDWTKYQSVHFWYDPALSHSFGGYKLPFAEIVNGSPKANWSAVTAAAAAMNGSRGGVNIPAGDTSGVKSRIATYYGKFSKLFNDPKITPPWNSKSADAGECTDCDQTVYISARTASADAAVVDLGQQGKAFEATLLVEGVPTSDGRLIQQGATYWRTPPLSLMLQTETAQGHQGAVIAGRIDHIYRAGNKIMASGFLDAGPDGIEAARLIGEKTLDGISIDGAVENPNDVSLDESTGQMVFSKIQVMGATITPFPAHSDANIKLAAAGDSSSILAELQAIRADISLLRSRDEIASLEAMFAANE